MADVHEKAIVYAALILADEGIEITADKLAALTNAAGVEVEPIWFNLFTKALANVSVQDMLTEVGAGSAVAAAPAAGAGAAAGGASAAADEPAEEAKEESDEDMGFGLFD